MVQFHQLMLRLKKEGTMPNHLYFASGNDLDKMFVQIKPGFIEKLRDAVADLNTQGP
jgi:hypothetical protein